MKVIALENRVLEAVNFLTNTYPKPLYIYNVTYTAFMLLRRASTAL